MVSDLSDQRKRKYILTPNSEWLKIRAVWESDPTRPTFRSLAKAYGIDKTTISKHAKAESWTRRDSLALATINAVQNDSKALVERTAATVTDRLSKQIADTLEPWLAKEKTRHIRSQIKRSKTALSQLDQHISKDSLLSPKDSSFIAKSAETWDTIARRNLGINDASPTAGSLNLNILTNHSAVEIKPSTSTGTSTA